MTVNQDIRDDLISHDIDLRKVDGDTRNKVNAMFDKMEVALKVEIVRIDPFTPTNTKIKDARLKRLEDEIATIIAETYREINAMMNERGKRIVVSESKQITNTIHDNIPQT